MDKPVITENTLMLDVVNINPKAAEILMSYGMHCLGCAMAHGETVAEAVAGHQQNFEEILEKLNDF